MKAYRETSAQILSIRKENKMKEIMDMKELSKYLRCSDSCIRKLKRENKIPYFKISSKILFDKAKIDNWLADKEVNPIGK